MSIDWSHILTALIAFIVGLIIKTLLDHNLAIWIVKYLSKTPVRFIYRTNPHKLHGDWEQLWKFTSVGSYSNDIERHSHTALKQLGKYVYAEFYSANEKYYMFGEIKDNYIVGHWGDLNDPIGYFGSFEIRIVNSRNMLGQWIGHSKKTQEIYGDVWKWDKKN